MIKYWRILSSNTNQFYVIGGSSGEYFEETYDNWYVVEESNGVMNNLPSMITPRANPAVTFNEDYTKIFVAGGDLDRYNVTNSWEFYDIEINMWIQIPKLNNSRSDASITWFNEFLYWFGGYNRSKEYFRWLDSIERVSLVYGLDWSYWELLKISLPKPRCNSWIIKESEDSILIIGGWEGHEQKSIFRIANLININKVPYIYELHDQCLETPDLFLTSTIAIDKGAEIISVLGFHSLHRIHINPLKFTSISYS